MFGNANRFTYSPGGFSPEDFPQQKRSFHNDDPVKSPPLQRGGLSRPSGKSIYIQRKDYSDTLNRQGENLHVRVEHLFTFELDGEELSRLEDCVAKLKRLDAKGRLWPQEMIMEVLGGLLLLSDIESKIELESLSVSSIMQTKAILDSCAYNSLLAITVQERSKRFPQVMMFQCEEMKADLLKADLDKIAQRRGQDMESHWERTNRNNFENSIGNRSPVGFQQPDQPPVFQPENYTPPPDYTPVEEMQHYSDREYQSSLEIPVVKKQAVRSTDILNHVINDVEAFMDMVAAAVTASSSQVKGKKKKKKSKKNASAEFLPPSEEYIFCLQKIKYGFNLLSQLEGLLKQPNAQDFVHIFFSCVAMLVPHYPAELPPTVASPLLTDATHELLCEVVTSEEENLWSSLGDSWTIPRSRWPHGDVPPYIPVFYDGWQPPAPSHSPQLSRSNSRLGPPDEPRRPMNVRPNPNAWNPPPASSREPPLSMRVMYNFVARNNRELSVMKGDVVQVIDRSKQWWLVSNARGEEGSIPQNVLEPLRNSGNMDDRMDAHGPGALDMSSTPAEVRAWLQHKGFSKITVSSLGVLNGKLLLGMTKEEIRTVCPEEGAKVFFQLQAVKSSIALAHEPSGRYNARY